MKQPQYYHNGPTKVYRGINWEYTLDGRDVLIHEIHFIAALRYATDVEAENAASTMATRAANA